MSKENSPSMKKLVEKTFGKQAAEDSDIVNLYEEVLKTTIEEMGKDQQPSGDVEKAAYDYSLKWVPDGDKDDWWDKKEKKKKRLEIEEHFENGAKWANTQLIKEDTPAIEDQKQFLDYIYWPKEWFEKVAAYCRENKITPIDLIENKVK